MTRGLHLILGDQLTPSLLDECDPDRDVVVMAEVRAEATYVSHHPKKIAFCFSAMRHFAEELRDDGWTVDYTKYDDSDAKTSISEALEAAVKEHDPDEIHAVEPGEHRLVKELSDFKHEVTMRQDPRFISTAEAFEEWADGRKELRMEWFYRDMRKQTGLLMEGDDPVGGKWNLDGENREAAGSDVKLPEPRTFELDKVTEEVLDLVEKEFGDNFGTLRPFKFAVTRNDAEAAFDHFIEKALPDFGTYQDAMLTGERFLFHSVISPYLNAGLLDPLDVCRRAEQAYHDGDAPLNSVEGFIRQIIGWREYVRRIYFHDGPGYTKCNGLKANRSLPKYYWTGETDMRCMSEAITQTRDEAYAHHIQRLMITGNFALLAGVDPAEVHEWYLAVYIDAYEWVEAPNTIGMSQYADGGLMGSKPYVSGGNYINKMSDYCKNCSYKVSKKTEEDACPFNALYWHFLDRHRKKLGANTRLGNMYRTWDRMADKQEAYLRRANDLLERIDDL